MHHSTHTNIHSQFAHACHQTNPRESVRGATTMTVPVSTVETSTANTANKKKRASEPKSKSKRVNPRKSKQGKLRGKKQKPATAADVFAVAEAVAEAASVAATVAASAAATNPPGQLPLPAVVGDGGSTDAGVSAKVNNQVR